MAELIALPVVEAKRVGVINYLKQIFKPLLKLGLSVGKIFLAIASGGISSTVENAGKLSNSLNNTITQKSSIFNAELATNIMKFIPGTTEVTQTLDAIKVVPTDSVKDLS